MGCWATWAMGESGELTMQPTVAPIARAYSMAASVYGVRPLAAIPTNTSRAFRSMAWTSATPWATSSSASSTP